MARPRGKVRETADELDDLLVQYRGKPHSIRIEMLKLLQNQPTMTMEGAARVIGRSERSIQRWWESYSAGGIDALLEKRRTASGRERKVGAEVIEGLRAYVARGENGGLEEVQEWLNSQYGVKYSRSGVWKLLRSIAEPQAESQVAGARGTLAEGYQSGIPDNVLSFLTALPVTVDPMEWLNSFREPLRLLLGDVDRITINVNKACDLKDPAGYNPDMTVSQHSSTQNGSAGTVTVTSHVPKYQHAANLLESLRLQGFPVKDYHPPHTVEYYYGGHAFLGTIILWRELKNPPISAETKSTLASLEPFMVFAFSDLVTRFYYSKPIEGVFNDAMAKLAFDAGLTDYERRILVLRLFGHSYKAMADTLHVSIDAVKKHLTQIHKKTGTSGGPELFAKYFTSRI